MEQLDNIRAAVSQLEKTVKQLHTDNAQLRKSLTALFEEDEIKACSSYELLKATYLIQEQTPAESHKEQVTIDLSSMYAPKWAHTKAKPAAKVSAKAPAPAPAPSGQTQVHENTELPTDECLLPDGSGIEVIKVTIDDKTYYYNSGKFYSTDTGKCVGKLLSGVIMIDGKPYTPEERRLMHVSDNYYKDSEDRAYVKCDDYIARVMGEIQEGCVYAYS